MRMIRESRRSGGRRGYRSHYVILLGLLAACLSASGCTSTPGCAQPPDNADEPMRFDSLADWVSFGDLIAVFHVPAEADSPTEQGGGSGGEPVVEILDVLHTSPSDPDPPTSLELASATDLQAGSRYVGSLVHMSSGWHAQSSDSVFILDKEMIVGCASDDGVRAEIGALDLRELEQRIVSTDPHEGVDLADPAANGYERYARWLEAIPVGPITEPATTATSR